MRRFIFLMFVFVLPCSSTLAIEFDDSQDAPAESDESSGDVFGDDFVPGILCDACRDPYEYPMDFVGVAYNALFGDDAWLFGSSIDWPFRIYNLDGDWVAVWFEDVLFDMPSLLPDTMIVMLRFENGRVVPYTVIQDGPDIDVGPDSESESGSAGCSCGGGEDDDEYSDFEDEWEYEEPEYTGVVEIEDPDDDGEFEPWVDEL